MYIRLVLTSHPSFQKVPVAVLRDVIPLFARSCPALVSVTTRVYENVLRYIQQGDHKSLPTTMIEEIGWDYVSGSYPLLQLISTTTQPIEGDERVVDAEDDEKMAEVAGEDGDHDEEMFEVADEGVEDMELAAEGDEYAGDDDDDVEGVWMGG